MTDESAPRFSTWFSRWWLASLGAVAAVGGGILWLVTRITTPTTSFGWFAYRAIPRGHFTYGPAADISASYQYGPLFTAVHLGGAVLFVAGLVAVAATIGYRLGRAR